jgi:hypothetical protein
MAKNILFQQLLCTIKTFQQHIFINKQVSAIYKHRRLIPATIMVENCLFQQHIYISKQIPAIYMHIKRNGSKYIGIEGIPEYG